MKIKKITKDLKFKVGDKVNVNGELAKGVAKVEVACYPTKLTKLKNLKLKDFYSRLKIKQDFPQICVKLLKNGNKFHFNAKDLLLGKISLRKRVEKK